MRLVNTFTLRLESFEARVPSYAILSHTWAQQEILYQDVCDPEAPMPEDKKGYRKFASSCRKARHDGHQYIWIDTCCIDKSSSAELSEAINSMFKFYRDAVTCYAYLADVVKESFAWQFGISKWFTRGWTLQELIAPDKVEFYDRAWEKLGERNELARTISQITRIDESVLSRRGESECDHFIILTTDSSRHCLDCGTSLAIEGILASFSIAARMAWAADRATTRLEDIAYCLLGIFDVNMPLLYGEGRHAFLRLQDELIKTSTDQSILAHQQIGVFTNDETSVAYGKVLADSPNEFRLPFQVKHNASNFAISRNNRGLTISLALCPCVRIEPAGGAKLWLGVLDCNVEEDFLARPAILLSKTSAESMNFKRVYPNILLKLSPRDFGSGNSAMKVYVTMDYRGNPLVAYIFQFDPLETERQVINLQPGDMIERSRITPALRVIHHRFLSRGYQLFASWPDFSGNLSSAGVTYEYSLKTAPLLLDNEEYCGVLYFAYIAFGSLYHSGFFVVWGLQTRNDLKDAPSSKNVEQEDTGGGNESENNKQAEGNHDAVVEHDEPWCAIIARRSGSSTLWDFEQSELITSEALRRNAQRLLQPDSYLGAELRALGQRAKEHGVHLQIRGEYRRIKTKVETSTFLGRKFYQLHVTTDRTTEPYVFQAGNLET